MVDFTKSLLSFAWAQSLFGAQQALNLLAPRTRGGTGPAFQAVADAAGGELDGWLRTAYELGCALQGQAADRLSLNLLSPFAVGRVALGALRQSAAALRLLASPDDLRLAWQEFRDKMRVFFWVREVGSLLNLPRDGSYVTVTELVARAYALDPFPALWAVEGAGHYYADSLRTGDQYPRDLLTDARAAAVPETALTMLHAGIGLSFGDNLLNGLTAQSSPDQVRDVVRRFLDLCRQNSRPGYVGAALESLGLAARDFHPQALVPLLDRALAELDPDAQAFFWHGVGRGIYFSPTYFLPVGRSPWQAVEMAKGEAPHELGRLNAIAGLAWGVTMVNLLKPEVLVAVVRQHADEFARDDAFSYGIASSVAMRYDTTPGQDFIAAFGRYEPSDPGVAAAWDALVKGPCEKSLGDLYPLLKEAGQLGELFRYQGLARPAERPRAEVGGR